MNSDNFVGTCHRLGDNDASLKDLGLVSYSKLIARFFQMNITDAVAFAEGMRHNTHLQGLRIKSPLR
jgi:hypothetical protein